MQYTVKLKAAKLTNTTIEVILADTHNLCFKAKSRKNVEYPHLLYKSGAKGMKITQVCLHYERQIRIQSQGHLLSACIFPVTLAGEL